MWLWCMRRDGSSLASSLLLFYACQRHLVDFAFPHSPCSITEDIGNMLERVIAIAGCEQYFACGYSSLISWYLLCAWNHPTNVFSR